MSLNTIDETTLENLHFFGAISASFSHEINNVVSIIKELSGLMADYLNAYENGIPFDPSKMKDKADKITNNTIRGETIIKNFNIFAHSADKPTQVTNLNKLLNNFVSITQRIANLNGTEVSFSSEIDDDVAIECNQFMLMNSLYIILQNMLEHSDKGNTITLSIIQLNESFQFIMKAERLNDVITDFSDDNALLSTLSFINGSVKSETTENGNYTVLITLPTK